MSGAVRDLSAAPPALPVETVDVCVIGSGCGGATAARVLAEAGRDVLVLEEGGDRTGERLTRREAAMYDQLYMDRGGRATDDLSITILQGRALGGGGVVNACDVVPIPDPVLRHWQTRFGLREFSVEALAPHRDRALADLQVRRIPESEVNRANRLLRDGARALGLRGEVMQDNRHGCAGLGTCLIGCPLDAKTNPRFVAVPAALAAGARFYTRARAVRIDGARDEVKTIAVRILDGAGHHERGEFAVRAKLVIVAANAINSAQLLLRSGIGNAHVGRHLTLQPQLPVTAIFDEEVDAFEGIPQSYAVTEFERVSEEAGLGGFRLEGIMGTPGIVASIFPRTGADAKAQMALYPRVAAALCLLPDAPSGTVTLTPTGRPKVSYAPDGDLHRRLREAARAAARIYLAAGARAVVVPVVPPVRIERAADLARLDGIAFPPASAPLLSAHQQGTVRFSPSERDGAAAPDGRVYGARDVLVLDSSGFPTTASTHTMAPIMTVARFLASALV